MTFSAFLFEKGFNSPGARFVPIGDFMVIDIVQQCTELSESGVQGVSEFLKIKAGGGLGTNLPGIEN